LRAAFDAGRIAFLGELARLSDPSAFAEYLEPLSKRPGSSLPNVLLPAPRRSFRFPDLLRFGGR